MKRILVGASVCVLTLSSCASGLSFRHDDRLTITAPADGELVSEPVLVEWTMRPRPASVKSFLVLVDRPPQPPGTSVEHFKVDDRSNLYPADGLSVEIPAFEAETTGPENRRNRHRIVVVPLDADGRRIGENSEHIEVDVFRDE
jgi:hypothetical protein